VLAQSRLAVIDLSGAVRYPMANESGTLWMLFNGEIYNHASLRSELASRGHRFETACDAEVVLHGYEEFGTEIFGRLLGMFAVALLDERSGEVLLVRDRLGIKPLVHTTGARFGFSSDAVGLVAAGLSQGAIDHAAVEEFLAFHYVPPPATGIADVRHVEPGTVLRRRADGTQTVERWTREPFAAPTDHADVDVAGARRILLAAVERHLVSDVEVGVLLSSGVDSRLILALAAELGARPPCFTVSFAGSGDYDETAGAARAATALGLEHHVSRIDTGWAAAVESVAGAFDGPFADASALATLEVSADAAQRVKVVLTGTGGDDLFAGYYRHRIGDVHRAVRHVPRPVLERMRRLRADRGAERRSRLALGRSYAARLAELAGGDAMSGYLAVVGSQTSPLGIGLMRRPADAGAAQEAVGRRLGLEAGDGSELDHIQRFECRTYLPYDLLVKEDRATMRHGLEGRVPLLDARVVELAESLPDRRRATAVSGKRLLRAVARDVLGESRLPQIKRGFAVPLDDLVRGRWAAEAADWMSSTGSDLVDGPAAGRAVAEGRLPATDAWALAVLMAWEDRIAGARRTASPAAGAPSS
jgi:asparagine synthase (glutamine-hydrolysing)